MRKIFIASGNAHKIRELSQLFEGGGFEISGMTDFKDYLPPEETGVTFEENARIKATGLRLYLQSQKKSVWVLADDSGLECDDLNGDPGVRSARYAGDGSSDSNNAKLVREISALPHPTRKARFVCVLVLMDPDGRETLIRETCEGLIVLDAKGQNGFGYDPYFYLSEFDKTMAELPEAVKNQISHRGKAFRKLMAVLQDGSFPQ